MKKKSKEKAKNNEHLVELRQKELESIKNLFLNLQHTSQSHEHFTFLSRLSHELKTPLNGLINATSLVKIDELSENNLNLFNSINHSSQRLNIIVNNLLDFYNFQANEFSLDIFRFDFIKVFYNLLNLFEKECKVKGINLVTNFDSNLKGFWNGDGNRIQQVFYNLIENAIINSEKGIIEINISLVEKQEGISYVKFKITDNGKGLSNKELQYISEPLNFEKIIKSIDNQGMGIGYSLSKAICKEMDGNIEVMKTSIKGTTIIGDFKLVPSKNQEPFSNKKKERILIVEDNQINQMLLKSVINKLGFYTEVANNGLEAIEKFKLYPYDIIFMDIQMPKLNGIEASKVIRKIESEKRRTFSPVKIIALTANTQKSDKKACKHAGMDEFISKPINPDQIKALLDLV